MSFLKRTLVYGLITSAVAAPMISGPSAFATSTRAAAIRYDVRTSTVEGCYVALDSKRSGGKYYVRARFHSSSYWCYSSRLERRPRNGDWRQVSYNYQVHPYHWVYTGWHQDSYPYWARGCTVADGHRLIQKCTAAY